MFALLIKLKFENTVTTGTQQYQLLLRATSNSSLKSPVCRCCNFTLVSLRHTTVSYASACLLNVILSLVH